MKRANMAKEINTDLPSALSETATSAAETNRIDLGENELFVSV